MDYPLFLRAPYINPTTQANNAKARKKTIICQISPLTNAVASVIAPDAVELTIPDIGFIIPKVKN